MQNQLSINSLRGGNNSEGEIPPFGKGGKGEIFGLLGPNGAGKTTTIKMLSGLSRPSSGTARIMGHDVVGNPVEVKKSIGVVPETSNLYPELTCFENLIFAGRLYGMSTAKARTKADELLGLFGLKEKRDVLFAKLSSGMKRRLTIWQHL